MRRPDGNPAPLLVLQHAVGSFGRQLCISYELDPATARLHTTRRCRGRSRSATSTAACAGVPPDEIVTSEGGDKLGIFGFAPACRR